MKIEAAKETLGALVDSGIDFAACLPDSAFKEIYEPLSMEPKIDYVQVANEGDGVGAWAPGWAARNRCSSWRIAALPLPPTR